MKVWCGAIILLLALLEERLREKRLLLEPLPSLSFNCRWVSSKRVNWFDSCPHVHCGQPQQWYL